ncbi:MAG: DUF815 domain-containing protein, partial [Burkholderiaceae bacterium]|nr:DUF815 domain-containing protein [Burkholderiaceae bacterium]
MTQLDQFLLRAEQLLNRVEALLPAAASAPDWQAGYAFRWRKRGQNSGQNSGQSGYLQAVRHVSAIALDDLQHVQQQKSQIEQNTRQFVL